MVFNLGQLCACYTSLFISPNCNLNVQVQSRNNDNTKSIIAYIIFWKNWYYCIRLVQIIQCKINLQFILYFALQQIYYTSCYIINEMKKLISVMV